MSDQVRRGGMQLITLGARDEEREAERELRYTLPPVEDPAQREYRQAVALVGELEAETRRLRRLGQPVPAATLRALEEQRERVRQAALARAGTAQLDPWEHLVRQGVVLEPYLDPGKCIETVLFSDILSSCVASMARNVGGKGYDFPCIHDAETVKEMDGKTQDAIEKERLWLERFFANCCRNPHIPFTELRFRTTSDQESAGYAAWEVLRNRRGKIVGLEHLPSFTFRLSPLSEHVDAQVPTQNEDGEWVDEELPLRFHTIIQIVNGKFRYFKQFYDPRVINRFTGRVAQDEDEASAWIASGEQAHEVLFFANYGVSGGITPYGIIRWLGATWAAQGRGAAAQVNLAFFDNNGVPPMAVLVSGGTLTREAALDVEEKGRSRKGRQFFWDVLVLEAVSPKTSGDGPDDKADAKQTVKVEIKEFQVQQDALHREYSKACERDVRMTFGLPSVVLGLSDDHTHATAEVAKQLVEAEVYQPVRDRDDYVINHVLFPAMGVKFHRFRTKGARIASEAALVGLIDGAKASITTDEHRAILTEKLGHDFPAFGTDWSTRPVAINEQFAKLGLDFTSESFTPPGGASDEGDDAGEGGADDGRDPTKGEGDKSVEADQADDNAEDTVEGRLNRALKRVRRLNTRRVFVAKVPEAELAGAEVIDGVLRLRKGLEEELTRRLREAQAAADEAEAARAS